MEVWDDSIDKLVTQFRSLCYYNVHQVPPLPRNLLRRAFAPTTF